MSALIASPVRAVSADASSTSGMGRQTVQSSVLPWSKVCGEAVFKD